MPVSLGDSNVIIPTSTKAFMYPSESAGDYMILFSFEGGSGYISNLSTYISSAQIDDTSIATASLSYMSLDIHPIRFGTTFITLTPKSKYIISPSRIPVYVYHYPKSGTALISGDFAEDLTRVELGSGITKMNDTFYYLTGLTEIDATKCPNVPICNGYPLDAIDPDYAMKIPCAKETEWRTSGGWSIYSQHMNSDCES